MFILELNVFLMYLQISSMTDCEACQRFLLFTAGTLGRAALWDIPKKTVFIERLMIRLMHTKYFRSEACFDIKKLDEYTSSEAPVVPLFV